ncbi:MAG TPA: thiazole biosynthesis protein [Firmicutes bacterium]|nr:thiazole biosynthesis protein [Bacillota bacterium]
MPLDDIVISEAIIRRYLDDLISYLKSVVAIVGAGPSGLTAAYYLARSGLKTVIFERRLSIGGGMWGGGMMFNHIVVQEEAREILDEFGINYKPFQPCYYTADSIEAVTTLGSRAVKAGAKIFNLLTAEDVMLRDDRVTGLVLNWSAVDMAKLHIDPLTIESSFTVDATGHDCQVVRILQDKLRLKLATPSGGIEGEKAMWAERGEGAILANTREVYPGLFVAGMAANAVFGSHRMGPIFGGMLLSGRRVAEIIREQRERESRI